MATNLWDTHLKSANCLISDYLNEYPLTENDSTSFSLCCCAWPTGPMTRSILCPPVISQPQRWMPALLGACALKFYDQVTYDMRCIMDSWRICRYGETGSYHFFLFSDWLSTWSGQHTYVSKLHVHIKSCFQSFSLRLLFPIQGFYQLSHSLCWFYGICWYYFRRFNHVCCGIELTKMVLYIIVRSAYYSSTQYSTNQCSFWVISISKPKCVLALKKQ